MFLLLLCVCLFGQIANGEYLFTMPRSAYPGSDLNFCFELLQYGTNSEDLTVEVDFRIGNESFSDFMETLAGQERQMCGELHIPADMSGTMMFTAVGMVDGDILFEKDLEVRINPLPELITLIQTDKPIYKPGQKVQFRVLTMDHELMPVTEGYPQIFIQSPGKQQMMQWLDVPAQNGLVSLEMQLSDEPPLGVWTIKVLADGNEIEQTFKVDEYVLPKFEVTIKPPSYLLASTRKVSGTVCAKYTYGKNVQGVLKMNVTFGSPNRNSWYYYHQRPTQRVIYDIDGCREFHIDADDLALGLREAGKLRYPSWGQLQIEASVTETATGITLESSSVGPHLSTSSVNIEMEDKSGGFYKPGFPYTAQVTVTNPDESPAPGEEIRISAVDYNTSVWNQTFFTDLEGKFDFTLDDLTVDSGQVHIRASLANQEETIGHYYYSVYTSGSSLYLQPWHSPSNSYIHMNDIEGQVESDSTLEIPVYYSSPPDTSYTFKVMVKAGNAIVHKMDVVNYFDGTNPDDLTADIDPSFILKKMFKDPVPSEIYPPFGPRPYLPVDPLPPLAGIPSIEAPEVMDGDGEAEDGKMYDGEPVVEEPIVPEVAKPLGEGSVPSRRRRDTSNLITHFMLDIPVTTTMAPNAMLLIYYVRDDLEVVAANLEFNVKNKFKNPVRISFAKDTVKPGENVTIQLVASPQSLCAVGVVDKSVQLLGGNSMVTPSMILDEVNQDRRPYNWYTFWREDDQHCSDRIDDGFRYDAIGADALIAFRNAEMHIVTDATIESRPCKKMPNYMYYEMPIALAAESPGGALMRSTDDMEDVSDKQSTPESAPQQTATKIRSYFPETWLWDLYTVGDDGILDVTSAIPDTITEWVGNSLCTNQETGVGVTESVAIKAFQPFFVSFTLPYSAIRAEVVPILTTIFNYLSECLPMRVTLNEMEGFEIRGGNNWKEVCVCGGESKSVTFLIQSTIIGEIDIEATAVSMGDSLVCGNEIISTEALGVSDGVQRQLLIEAEGVPQDQTQSFYMCPEDGVSISKQVTLSLPFNLVPDSERGSVAVIGDVMGPALSNLKNLLRVPYGCGEQNMASFVPNIFVLEYLTSTGQSDPDTAERAKRNMRTGYQRQLNYRHHDSSYSAFGDNSYRNATGSLWLTAFVVKSLLQASEFITVDESDIRQSTQWILEQQEPDGCFPRVGKVFGSYLKGGLGESEENKAGLTAFVLTALLEKPEFLTPEHSELVDKAMSCLDAQRLSLDTYSLTVMLYAYTLYDLESPRRQEVMDELKERANTDVAGQQYWARSGTVARKNDFTYWYRAPSAEVEMTAYVLLSILKAQQNSFIVQAQPIVQWLTGQRNAYGGFSSTQDTVVALAGLSLFGRSTFSEDSQLSVEVKGEFVEHLITVDPDNRRLYQTRPINPTSNTNLDITVSGAGCAIVQVNLKFNIMEEEDNLPKFNLRTVVYRSMLDINDCEKRRISVCTSYMSGASNMAIVSVKMVTGWSPIKSTLQELVGGREGVEKFEIDNNMVQFYFDQLTELETCFSFEVLQEIRLTTKPALVRVYDYYETDHTVVTNYSIKTTCGTKEELPVTGNEENEQNPDFIGQIRVTDKRRASCPICDEDSIKDLTNMICSSQAIYKSVVGRSGDFPIKLKANLKTKVKTRLDDFVTYVMDDQCLCPILTSNDSRALIFSSTGEYDTDDWMIDENLVILPQSPQLESEVRRLSLPKRCARLKKRALKEEKKIQEALRRIQKRL